jgi:hypothetical protein
MSKAEDKELKQELMSQLKEKGIPFSFNSKAETLQKLLDESGDAPEVQVLEKPSLPSDYFQEIAKKIKEETSEKPTIGKNKDKVWYFVSKHFTLSLSPRGLSKSNKMMRYVSGLDTLSISEQERMSDRIVLKAIIFQGSEGVEHELPNYKGRGMLRTTDPTLAEFLVDHERYGDDFILYDKDALLAEEVKKEEKITLAKASVFKAPERDLVRVLTYVDMRNGVDSYDKLKNKDATELKRMCTRLVDKDIDTFISVMESGESKLIYLINLCVDKGILVPTSDGRQVKTERGEIIIKSSLSRNWQEEMKEYLISERGAHLLKEMVSRTGYYV